MAPRHGFEPRFTAPKAAVLPLDDRGMGITTNALSPFSLPAHRPRCNDPSPLQWAAEGNLDWCSGRSSKPFGGPKAAGVFDSHCLPPIPLCYSRLSSRIRIVNPFTFLTIRKGVFPTLLLICKH